MSLRAPGNAVHTDMRTAALFAPVGQWRPSMARLNEELQAGLIARGVEVLTPTPSRDDWFGRMAMYPFTARRAKADLYHVTDHSLGHVAALLPKRRTVISCHDLFLLRAAEEFPEDKYPWRYSAQFEFSTSYLRKAAAVVALTAATKADTVKYLGVDPDRIDVIHLGVNEKFRVYSAEEKARIRARLGETQPLIVHIGHTPYKNLQGVVRTLAEVRRNGIDAKLLHIGRPLWGEAMEIAEREGVLDSIRELGRISDDELVDVLNAADVLFFPSRWEGMGWPPLEAMACGLPAVTSNIAPIVEVAGAATLAADADDVAAHARHICQVLTDPALVSKQRELGFAQVADFTWARAVDKYLAVYRKVWEQSQS